MIKEGSKPRSVKKNCLKWRATISLYMSSWPLETYVTWKKADPYHLLKEYFLFQRKVSSFLKEIESSDSDSF